MAHRDLKLHELIAQIEGGATENDFVGVDFKSRWEQEFGKDISAIANHIEISRGWIIIGLDDNGNGLSADLGWSKKMEAKVSNHVRQYLTPGWAVAEITTVQIKGAECVAIEIRNPGDVVYWNNVAFHLIGTTSSEMKPHDITALSLRLPGADFSKMQYDGQIDAALVVKFAQKMAEVDADFAAIDLSKATPEDLLRKLNIHKTNTAGILFGRRGFRVVHFDENGDILDQKTTYGIYNMLTDEFVDEILSWTRKQGTIIRGSSTSVIEENPYAVKGLREVLANAAAHTYYQRDDGDIVVELHPNRLTVSNLCHLDAKAFVNKWFSRAHKSSNKHLMNTLRAVKATDEQGSGKIRVFRYLLEEGRRPPIVEWEDHREFGRWKITLYNDQGNDAHVRLYARMKENFSTLDEARIAQALILWRKMRWSEIVVFLDDNYKHVAETVLESKYSPVLRYDDTLYTKRWTKVALEGQVTQQFTEAEKNEIYFILSNIAHDGNRQGHISSEEARDFIGLSDTQSEIVQMSRLFSDWASKKLVKQVKKGNWLFIRPSSPS